MVVEDKELGLKVAVNEEEAYWQTMKKQSEESIVQSNRNIALSEEIIKFADKKISAEIAKNKA